MKQELIVTGKTIEAALALGADQLGVDSSKVTYEILEHPKKGFFGIGEADAKLKIIYSVSTEQLALDFINMVISDMEIDVTAEIVESDGENACINLSGKDAGMLIGHHGDTLDAIQYLANLAANHREDSEDKADKDYTRISVDAEGYRAKREQTLKQLARRVAEKVKKHKKNVSLEPMNSYERRIIHSEIQTIEGVTTHSVGSDINRRVIVSLEGGESESAPKKSSGRRRGGKPRSSHKTEE